jgi:hypothetical protein
MKLISVVTGVDCCGHLLEAALAHHKYTGSRKFLNAMIKVSDPAHRAHRTKRAEYADVMLENYPCGPRSLWYRALALISIAVYRSPDHDVWTR